MYTYAFLYYKQLSLMILFSFCTQRYQHCWERVSFHSSTEWSRDLAMLAKPIEQPPAESLSKLLCDRTADASSESWVETITPFGIFRLR